ncbi:MULTISPECIES: pyrophosphatase PpaX [Lysinibacillus]|jgi:pyrophosphatase PpaX|uniref:Pyrophosphatase PpaX n=1 Tax=Lysinibacillus fusiformis TaxID=28031 RepID=A0A2I0V2W3_9BACI|nr:MULTISPECIES: pyrophosphatase PpaX [Lysinibacillus]KUF32457.1 pyrophosphatase [Lysinibacillus sp. F5]MEE3808318.1 pyrophosphatase PpaX [Lysinibacillus fusiformis]PKU52651.1 pyrophosphatase PpaX [Lysinibacillus fusiformis]WCH47092.1 pyrophosphatase PpaX [Lysinibacillus sp. OF-1]SCY88470.1 pyrophosphatase PpaX [Lysinibacillus sp. SG9]
MAVKALLFDFDGTLLNTNDLIIQTFMHVLNERFPGQYSPKDCLKFIGPSLKQTFNDIAPDEEEALIANYRAWNIEHHDELVSEYPDVVSTLEQLKAQGIRLAIVSTKRNETIDRGLSIMGATHLFDVRIGTDDVKNVKPDPEPVLLALQRLGIDKEDAIMIGDNSHDIEAGHRAGVRAAGVAWAIKGEAYLQQYQPEYMLQHMTDLLDIVKEG